MTQVAEALTKAKAHLDERHFDRCFVQLQSYWLENPDDEDAVKLFAELMQKVDKKDLAVLLNKLAEGNNLAEDAQTLFEVAFYLIDERANDLAVMLLERCAKLVPHEATVNYELGFALMSQKQFDRAVGYFERAASAEKNFDLILNQVVCYTMLRQIKNADKAIAELSKLARSEDELIQLGQQKLVIERFKLLADKETFDARDWYYILYGGLLIQKSSAETVAADSSSHDPQACDYDKIAETLCALAQLLSEIKEKFASVEYYNQDAKPLAACLGEVMSLPVESYQGPDRTGRALLVLAWAAEVIGPHKSFVELDDKRTIFALALPGEDLLPLAPEIVGLISDIPFAPWSNPLENDLHLLGTGYEPALPEAELEDTRKKETERAGIKLIELAKNLHKSQTSLTKELLQFLDAEKRNKLLLCNQTTIKQRPEYSAEI
jgi:tetratricopeptide (TPR) repeat protein